MKEFMRYFIFFAVVVLVGRPMIEKLRDTSTHRGPWYTVKVPPGWEKKVEGDTVSFSCPEENILVGMPEAVFNIFSQKMEGAAFIEDMFPEILQMLSKEDGRILDKGEIMIDGQVCNWVLFMYNEPEVMMLTFFTVDDFNRFTRVQYLSPSREFQKHRPAFEQFKDSIRFKKMI